MHSADLRRATGCYVYSVFHVHSLSSWCQYVQLGSLPLTAVVMKNSVLWDITPCSPLKDNIRSVLATCFTLVSCLAHSLTLKVEVTFLRNVGWLSTDCTAFVFQKIEVFITTAVRTSNPTSFYIFSYWLFFVCLKQPVTVVARSKEWTVFARSDFGIVGSKPTQSKDVWRVCMCLFCLCCFVFR
jgi:hypothetical protein